MIAGDEMKLFFIHRSVIVPRFAQIEKEKK